MSLLEKECPKEKNTLIDLYHIKMHSIFVKILVVSYWLTTKFYILTPRTAPKYYTLLTITVRIVKTKYTIHNIFNYTLPGYKIVRTSHNVMIQDTLRMT